MSQEKPSPCQICGKILDDNPIKTDANSCEHSRAPPTEFGPAEGKIIKCPMCKIVYDRISKWRFIARYKQKKLLDFTMSNPYENYYKCLKCWYGYRA